MSDAHEHIEPLDLVRGELSTAEVTRAARHLEGCQACRDELADVAVGHALLARTSRTLAGDGPRPQAAAPLPPLVRPTGRTLPRRWVRPLGVAAAAVLLVGGTAVVTRQLDDRGTTPVARPPATERTQTATLRPVAGFGTGRVVMVTHAGGTVGLAVHTRDLPRAGAHQFYYAWLLDPVTNKMAPLGQIGPRGEATFDVPVRLLGRYDAIDVSIEDDDGDPEHSVTSVLRGVYDPGAETRRS